MAIGKSSSFGEFEEFSVSGSTMFAVLGFRNWIWLLNLGKLYVLTLGAESLILQVFSGCSSVA